MVKDREKLVRLEAGGSPERAITISSASVVEGSARSTPCHQCGRPLDLESHEIERFEDALLRVVRCRCQACHSTRTMWFRIARTHAN